MFRFRRKADADGGGGGGEGGEDRPRAVYSRAHHTSDQPAAGTVCSLFLLTNFGGQQCSVPVRGTVLFIKY